MAELEPIVSHLEDVEISLWEKLFLTAGIVSAIILPISALLIRYYNGSTVNAITNIRKLFIP